MPIHTQVESCEIGPPGTRDLFRVTRFLSKSTHSGAGVDLVAKQNDYILGWLESERRQRSVIIRAQMITEESREMVLDGLLSEWLKHHDRTLGPVRTNPLEQDEELLAVWRKHGFAEESTQKEIEYSYEQVTTDKVAEIVRRLRATGKIPSAARLEHYGEPHLSEVESMICPLGLIRSAKLRALTLQPYSGFDRDLSAVIYLEDVPVGCILATVPKHQMFWLEVRMARARHRGWVNAWLLHHITQRVMARGLSKQRYLYNTSTMGESGNLAARSEIPSRVICQRVIMAL